MGDYSEAGKMRACVTAVLPTVARINEGLHLSSHTSTAAIQNNIQNLSVLSQI